jgi:hypothetical protein
MFGEDGEEDKSPIAMQRGGTRYKAGMADLLFRQIFLQEVLVVEMTTEVILCCKPSGAIQMRHIGVR